MPMLSFVLVVPSLLPSAMIRELTRTYALYLGVIDARHSSSG